MKNWIQIWLLLALTGTGIYLGIQSKLNREDNHSLKGKVNFVANTNPDAFKPAAIPDGMDNFRYHQPTADELHQLLDQNPAIRRVIRLNGNEDDRQLTIEEEHSICRSHGVAFVHINAHEGYRDGRGYQRSASQVHFLLKQGGNLIHCKHGYDRVGAMVGYHLKQLGFGAQFIIEHNDWQEYLKRKGPAYAKYYETALYGL